MYRRPILWTLYNALDFLKVLKIAVVGGGGGGGCYSYNVHILRQGTNRQKKRGRFIVLFCCFFLTKAFHIGPKSFVITQQLAI
jgi:hypothetical protein